VASLIDSSVLVDVERGRTELAVLLEHQDDRGVAMAAITAAELLHGVHRLRVSKRKPRAEALVETLLSVIPVLEVQLLA
jgi:tRNA(fMet)-specific endonuclease VapC